MTKTVSWLVGSVFATLVGCQTGVSNLQDTFVGNLDPQRTPAVGPPIAVTGHGAIPDDGLDDTQAILEAALAARCKGVNVLFPTGTYDFQLIDPVDGPHDRQSWSLTKLTIVESWRFISSAELQGKRFDCKTAKISGVQHNLFERKVRDSLDGTNRLNAILEGDFLRPPIATPPLVNLPIDVLAHWWSRFGAPRFVGLPPCTSYDPCGQRLKCWGPDGIRLWKSAYGLAEYTWEWNHFKGKRPSIPRVCPDGRTILVRNDGEHQVGYPEPYDPGRHPLLGWYREDDPIILDWIAYWLVRYGVRGVILAGSPLDHPWVGALFNKTRNFAQLNYVMWLPSWHPRDQLTIVKCHNNPTPGCSTDGVGRILSRWEELFQQTYYSPLHGENAHTVQREINGNSSLYATVYLYDVEEMRKGLGGEVVDIGGKASWRPCALDCGIQELFNLLVTTADNFRNRIDGIDGIAVMINRDIPSYLISRREELAARGVILVSANYAGVANFRAVTENPAATYSDMIEDAMGNYNQIDWSQQLVTVQTAGYTYRPHDPKWPWEGTTPSLFSAWLSEVGSRLKEKQAAGELPFKTPALTVYNVSEWMEGGQSLQPSIKYGFGYLQAIRNFVMSW